MIRGNAFTVSDLTAGQQKVIAGAGHGFSIVPASGTNRGSYPLKLIIKDMERGSQSECYVGAPGWKRVKEGFRSIAVEALGSNEAGTWYINVGTFPEDIDFIQAAPPNPATDFPPALGGGGGTLRTFSEVQAGTRAAPTLVTEGMDLSNAGGLLYGVSADAGQTVTGGSLDLWRYDSTLARWGKSFNAGPLPTGQRLVWMPEETIKVADGRILPATNAVTVSAGTITVIARARV